MLASIPWETPGRVEWRVGGGVPGPGVMNGCLATWRALITTAWEPWYLADATDATKKQNGTEGGEKKFIGLVESHKSSPS